MNSNEIRSKFLEFFRSKNHVIKSSASLVPADPTVLFSIAGMVQFKKMFLGEVPLEFTRAATSQKCVRTNDIENVGITARHHTFFEMLGNFSFGDYFKKEAITWAWEFLTKELSLPQDKLYITIYEEDNESFDIWHNELKIPEDKIYRMGKDTNFWTMGDTGPCGPCSEILFDLGPKFGCNKPGCTVGCDCDRYLEIWNLVFTQYDKHHDGKLTPLPKKNIDTGMGLERLARVLQKVNNNYETDLLFPIIKNICDRTKIKYGDSDSTDINFKVIADHIRAITFLICDGVIPSNEERGYVLRRLIRRSVIHGNLLGFKKPFLNKLSEIVINIMKDGYPELEERQNYINKTILAEEDIFTSTLERAQHSFSDIVSKCKKHGLDTISGEDAFILSDTYGLPISITEILAQTYNLKIDYAGYEKLFEIQQNRSRENWHNRDNTQNELTLNVNLPKTVFNGYSTLTTTSKILYLIQNNVSQDTVINENSHVAVILDETPFYAEGGGQTGDIGIITCGENNKIVIENTVKNEMYYIHLGRLVKGKISKGDMVQAIVNEEHRKSTARNHTSTHLLQAALRRIFGIHINQAGSLVTPEYLRFDFTHFSTPSRREIEHIEELVNSFILANENVESKEKSLAEAKKEGATALFGEKYGEKVRVVKIGEVSKELCGGTHVKNTGEIGIFKIIKEESIASGIRRIEAISGGEILRFIRKQESILEDLCDITRSTPEIIKDKIVKLQETIKTLEKEKEKLMQKFAGDKLNEILEHAEELNGVKIISAIMPEMSEESLRKSIDDLKNKHQKGVFILGSKGKDKAILTIGICKQLTPELHAGQIIKEAVNIIGGKGGGRPDLACAGGPDISKLEDSISYAVDLVKKKITKN